MGKNWQNGTQAQLDAAKDDARLIPKKTYFIGPHGYSYQRAIDCSDDENGVFMIAIGANEVVASGYLSAGKLNAD